MADSDSRERSMTTDRDAGAAIRRLLEVMARLLAPDGCPWDRAQTHRSLLPYALEEAYELIEAIESGAAPDGAGGSRLANPAAVREELGDLLLQVVFHARLAEQAGAFDFAAVADGLTGKLIERHPHVFAQERSDTAAQVSDAWERGKLAGRESRLDGIPRALPALMLASKVGSRVARAGFEWSSAADIYAKAHEEVEEFRAAMGAATTPAGMEPSPEQMRPAAPGPNPEAAELEFGDLLFSLVQLARWIGIDPEAALRRSTAKFAARFRHMEGALRKQGRDPAHLDADGWWELWAQAKREESPR